MSDLGSAIDKTTSPDLTDDDYSLLLDVVDIVKSDPDTNIEESINLLKLKLQSQNANTVLRSITLLDFLAENCGAMMKAEISKKNFVNNYLLHLVNSQSLHISVKYAVIKEFYKLSKTFKNDDSLKIMNDTFNSLKSNSNFKYLCQQAINEVDSGREPDLNSSSAQNINNNNRHSNANNSNIEEEDDDLRKAIELSLRESQSAKPQSSIPNISVQAPVHAPANPSPQNSATNQFQNQAQPLIAASPIQMQPSGSSVSLQEDVNSPEKVRALYDLTSDDEDTLSFKKDDIITIIENVNSDWLRGCLNGKLGIIPVNYVEKIPKTTENDLNDLLSVLNGSFNIEVLLSKLMDLNTKIKSTPMTSSEFETILINDAIPAKLENLQKIKAQLKKVLDLYKLKLMELQSMEKNVDNSLILYQSLITKMSPVPQNDQISKFMQTYPNISGLSIDDNQFNSPPSPSNTLPQQTPGSLPQFGSGSHPMLPTSTGSANYLLQQHQNQQQQQPSSPNFQPHHSQLNYSTQPSYASQH